MNLCSFQNFSSTCWQLAGEKKERGPQTVLEESICFANDDTSGSMEVRERALTPVVVDRGCPAHFIVPELPTGLQSKEAVLLYIYVNFDNFLTRHIKR